MENIFDEKKSNKTIIIVVVVAILGAIGYLMWLTISAAKANKFYAETQLQQLNANRQPIQQQQGQQNLDAVPHFPNTKSNPKNG